MQSKLLLMKPRTSLMADRNDELVARLAEKPEVIGIMCHGSFSDNPRHESDAGSDLDLTVIIDSKVLGSTHVDWANFKSYQAMPDGKPLEVDLYLFDINDDRPWDIRTREGYSHSASLVFDRDGRCQEWLDRHTEITPEEREINIKKLLSAVQRNFRGLDETSVLDCRLEISNMVKALEEAIYWINWEYPVDPKWRLSLISTLEWKPTHYFNQFSTVSQTKNPSQAVDGLKKLIREVVEKVAEEGIEINDEVKVVSNNNSIVDERLQLERLWTRLDNYSEHTPKKCIARTLAWNAHDIVWAGVNNAIDLIYALNNAPIPTKGKFEGLKELAWLPHKAIEFLYRAAIVRDYGSGNSAAERACALRELFLLLTPEVAKKGLFKMGSLYSSDFIHQSLFGEDAIFTHMFREGGYINRQQPEDTYAVRLLKRLQLHDALTENMLWGCCNQYFVSTDEELVALLEQEELEQVYKTVLAKVIPQLK